ncbi:nucleolar protein 16-like [Ornithodoros turicata]|uniref:Nucleolar protein 16 n=1 Tax=Ornithodoros turicata TaxID=34597 RepID=A0A2R5LHT0_9ACAR
MGNARKSRKRKNGYNYSVNHRRKLKKKLKRRVKIKSKPVKEAWDETKGVYENMKDMGLSSNPNEMDVSEDVEATKKHVVEALEAEASQPTRKTLRMSGDNVKFCVYMLEKYGEDYKAMAKDSKNYYQHTPAQIRQKIKTLQKIPEQWNAYLKAKQMCGEP